MESMKDIDINKLTQYQYDRLMSVLAKSVGTLKKFITIESARQADNGDCYYGIRRKGFPYMVVLHGYRLVHVSYVL